MKKVLILSTFLIIVASSFAQDFKISSDPVFRNENGEVLDLALTGGLNQPQFSNIDINNDGNLDLFIYDRSGDKVLFILSLVDGSDITYYYEPLYEEYMPKGQEFMQLTDYNDDGKPDLWLYDDQNTDSVVLYQNNTNGWPQFDEVGKLFAIDNVNVNPTFPYKKIGQVTGSLPSIIDIDNDDDLDVINILNPGGSSMILYCNNSTDSGKTLEEISFEIVDKCYGGVDETAGELVINAFCYFTENYKNKKKHIATKTIRHFDNDDDGDYDLFYGSSEKITNPVYFMKNGKKELNFHKDTFIELDTAYFPPAVEALIPIAPSMSCVDVNLDGVLDLVMATNETDITSFPLRQTKNVLYFENLETTSDPNFSFQTNTFLVDEMIDFGAFTSPCFADIDGDNDQDLFIATNGDNFETGDSSDHIVFLENIGSSSNPEYQIKDMDYLSLKARKYKHITPTFADINGDNTLDLVFGIQDGTMTMIPNNGSATSPSFGAAIDNYLNMDVGTNASPCFYDLNNDGKLDLLAGSYSGTVQYYENVGSTANPSFNLEDDSLGGMLANELIPQTILGPDGFYDTLIYQSFGNSTVAVGMGSNDTAVVVLGGYQGKIKLFKIPTDITQDFKENTNYLYHVQRDEDYEKDFGANTHPAVADLNNDGISDVLIGNNRGGVHYMEGTRVKAGIVQNKSVGHNFLIYPNPSLGYITIKTPNSNRNLNYTISDLQGRIVQSGVVMSSKNIQLQDELSNGAYFIELKGKSIDYNPQKFILLR